jgi:hypothetical protein
METTKGFAVSAVKSRKGETFTGTHLGMFATIAEAFAGVGEAIESDESGKAEYFLFVIDEEGGSRKWTITIGL